MPTDPGASQENSAQQRAFHVIDGDRVLNTDDEVEIRRAPIVSDGVGAFPLARETTIDAAITSSVAAFGDWSAMSLDARVRTVLGTVPALRAAGEEIAAAESWETGRSIVESRALVHAAIGQFEFYAGLAEEGLGSREGPAGTSVRRPYGPTALIVPWNYPITIAMRTLAALVLAGNTVIWKPSEKTPLSASVFMSHLSLPPGVVNLVLGDGVTGRRLVEDSRIRFVVHTGSTAAGRSIAEVSGKLLRPTLLELGGKDAVIVDRDADVSAAAKMVVRASFENAGQICTSAERVLVHQEIHEAFVVALRNEAREWTLGRHDAERRQIGPLIDDHQRSIVESLVGDAVARGAHLVVGGRATNAQDGAYFEPTVVDKVEPEMAVFTAELFGPVVAVTPVRDMSHAVELANASTYGLAATVFSSDPDASSWAANINTAIVWQGSWHASVAGSTFEPYGDSGLGASGPGLATLHAVSRPMIIGGRPSDV